jgi:hypothetical protein
MTLVNIAKISGSMFSLLKRSFFTKKKLTKTCNSSLLVTDCSSNISKSYFSALSSNEETFGEI